MERESDRPTGLRKVVSGGQTGADQAGLRAARAAGLETGGWAPRGWLTEGGPDPSLADYGLVECWGSASPVRTRLNARDSDATLWFGGTDSPGYLTTVDACRKHGKPFFLVTEAATRPGEVREWLTTHRVGVLNVAGDRESRNPGHGRWVEAFLKRVFADERGTGR